MNGFYVERRFGWDCHGLPVEHEIDKKLGIKSKQDVMDMGIAKYNAECRAIVMRYSKEWRDIIERVGRWVDFDNDYKTLNTTYMETVWWVFKQLFEKDSVYRGRRVMPYSTGCTTPLSNFEAGLNYKDVSDPSVVVSFPLVKDPEVKLLAWTTTPWTLPSNIAVCVHPDFTYVKIKDGETGETWILGENRLEQIYKDVKKAKYEILGKYKGSEMKGWEYVPLFNYFVESMMGKPAYTVVVDTYVTDDAGTGIVQQAPAFGEDDYRIAIVHGILTPDGDLPCPVNETGLFTKEVPDYEGQYVKEADKVIQKDIKAMGRLVRQTQFFHSYPFCWRSDTPLLYKAVPVWFVRVKEIIDEMLENTQKTHWVPTAVKEKRFANWLSQARDWNVSRNRYWGTPIPIWVSDDFEEMVCIGSLKELEDLAGCGPLEDIHRDKIDHITIPSRKGKGVLRRVEEVFDCWFESGSMPYGQQHYPFENKAKFEGSFPADFVAEGLDQTRGWFYTLLVLGTHLFKTAPYKNVIVNGLILAGDGKKMSKSLKNYPDPKLIIDKYGADALRIYLINSPVVRGDTLRFKEEGVKEVLASIMIPWYNSLRFFTQQVTLLQKESNVTFAYDAKMKKSDNVMDRWILASCQSLIKFIHTEMAAYRLYTVIPRLLNLIGDLTNWYIRFNRKRLKGENGPKDTVEALNTLFEVLFTLVRLMAPFTPFIADNIYQTLRKFLTRDAKVDERSVHFLPFPEARQEYIDPVIERQVTRMQTVIELGRLARDKANVSVKTPLRELVVLHPSTEYHEDIQSLETYIAEELNILKVSITADEDKYGVSYTLEADRKSLGIKFRKEAMKIIKALPGVTSEQARQFVQKKTITIEGSELTEEDLNVIRSVKSTSTSTNGTAAAVAQYEVQTDKDVLVLLDVKLDAELQNAGLAREVINRVQRLRKKAGLVPTDEVQVYYTLTKDEGGILATVISTQGESLTKALKRPMKAEKGPSGAVIEEETEVSVSYNKW